MKLKHSLCVPSLGFYTPSLSVIGSAPVRFLPISGPPFEKNEFRYLKSNLSCDQRYHSSINISLCIGLCWNNVVSSLSFINVSFLISMILQLIRGKGRLVVTVSLWGTDSNSHCSPFILVSLHLCQRLVSLSSGLFVWLLVHCLNSWNASVDLISSLNNRPTYVF